ILPAGLVLLALSRRLPPRGWWGRVAALAVLRQALFFVLLYGAALHLPGGVAATVGASSAMLVVVLAWPLLGQAPTRLNLSLAGAGLAGVALISLSGGEHLSALGLGLALGFALVNALGTVLFGRWGPPPGARPLDQVAWELTLGGLLLLPFALPSAPALAGVDPAGWAALTFMTLIGTALAALLWQRGLNRLPVQQVGLLAPLSPLTAVVLDMLFLHTWLTPLQLAGAALVMSSVVLNGLAGRRPAGTDTAETGTAKLGTAGAPHGRKS
ncbi:MAG: DMT family transporter, partial [Deinococcus sp.]|nr:DMT family transporter [Deinococcus sp.]